MKKAGQPQTNRLSHRPLFNGAIFLFPITVVPERHHRINARFLFVKKSLLLLFVDSILWNLFLLAPAAFATSATKIIRLFNLSHRIVKNLPIQQHGDMMYTAVLYLLRSNIAPFSSSSTFPPPSSTCVKFQRFNHKLFNLIVL